MRGFSLAELELSVPSAHAQIPVSRFAEQMALCSPFPSSGSVIYRSDAQGAYNDRLMSVHTSVDSGDVW